MCSGVPVQEFLKYIPTSELLGQRMCTQSSLSKYKMICQSAYIFTYMFAIAKSV